MALHLVTGYKGTPHITADDVGAFNAGIIGLGDYVLPTGNKLSASMTSSNTVKILDGDAVIQGRHISLKKDTYEELTINNGENGKNRNDLIVIRYTKDGATGSENATFAVIQGTSTDGTAIDPEYTTGDILSGDCILHEMPLYRIPLTGLTVGEPEALFEVVKNQLGGLDGLLFKGKNPFSDDAEDIPAFWAEQEAGIWSFDDVSKLYGGKRSADGTTYGMVGSGNLMNMFSTNASNGKNYIFQLLLYGSYAKIRSATKSASKDWNSATFSNWKTLNGSGDFFSSNSYSGNGHYGSEYKNKIILDFTPRFGIVVRADQFMFLHPHQQVSYFVDPTKDEAYQNTVEFSDTTVSWYSTSAEGQANSSGVYYCYAFFG